MQDLFQMWRCGGSHVQVSIGYGISSDRKPQISSVFVCTLIEIVR